MGDGSGAAAFQPLRILHVLRAPVGGLFRHVCDLATGQRLAGHKVAVVCGEVPGDPVSQARLRDLAAQCELGVHVIPMNRMPGFGDLLNMARMTARARAIRADVIHGHGAKGGFYARMLPRFAGGVRVYTPHGGTLHFGRGTAQGVAFFGIERLMRARTDGFIFESDFGLRTFIDKIGEPEAASTVIHNGVGDEEFAAVETERDAADFVFVGELRKLKGVGTLIDAASLAGRRMHLRIVGAGAERATFEEMAGHAPSDVRIEFMGAMPARKAFALGRAVVMPSHHESLPYIALEAIAAGRPLIATRVGGMAEIFGADADALIAPGDPAALADALCRMIDCRGDVAGQTARLKARVRAEFSTWRMVDGVGGFYRALLDKKASRAAHAGPRGAVARFHEGVPS
ncbi:MAG: glycosyltransferase [Parvibaculum sp.]|uniref:glycosyltransferase n=1 Tax=Parvibaculum sp. TaxID=2024848 RepID=UPI00284EF5A4|nr:glycosyltransferase [Parvibaculum sp.]MDR3498718.1 glycosyltransferase [Parvibaculum sp.]